MERGKIIHKERSLQVKDFSGLQFGKITPTDIDMSVDFGGKLFMFAELKSNGAELPAGQRWHLESLVKACMYPAAAYIVEHDTPVDEDIDVANTIVKERFSNTQLLKPRWIKPERDDLRLREEMDRFKEFIERRRAAVSGYDS